MKIGDKVRVKSNYVEKNCMLDYMEVRGQTGKIIKMVLPSGNHYLTVLVAFKGFKWWCSKNWISNIGFELE